MLLIFNVSKEGLVLPFREMTNTRKSGVMVGGRNEVKSVFNLGLHAQKE